MMWVLFLLDLSNCHFNLLIDDISYFFIQMLLKKINEDLATSQIQEFSSAVVSFTSNLFNMHDQLCRGKSYLRFCRMTQTYG